jgi:uncharacterized membrane protein HdeD (DUF308 family)
MPEEHSKSGAEAVRRVSVWVRAVILLMLGSYLASTLVLPWKAASLLLGAAGVLVGVVATVKAARRKAPVLLRITVPLATVACLLFTLSTSAQVVFYQPTADYEQCLQETVTDRSHAKCRQDYENKISQLQGIIGS